jgi:hypothetical protein
MEGDGMRMVGKAKRQRALGIKLKGFRLRLCE